MCIYLGNSNSLHYIQEEHIFSSFLGGRTTLPLGMVSDEANHILSLLENELAHKSLVQITRGFYGPGKRGSNKPNNVIIYPIKNKDKNYWKLGYLFLGKPHLIPCIYVKNQEFIFSCDEDKDENIIKEIAENFFENLKNFLSARYSEIEIQTEDTDFFLIGYYQKKWYLFKGNLSIEEIYVRVNGIIASRELSTQECSVYQPEIYGMFIETENANRAYAKMAFNVLAYCCGEEFVSHTNFDIFRRWIILGEKNSEIEINDLSLNETWGIEFPKDSHWCLLLEKDNTIYAIITLYNKLSRGFKIGEIPEDKHFHLAGRVCDWRNKKEYTLCEWIDKYSDDINKNR